MLIHADAPFLNVREERPALRSSLYDQCLVSLLGRAAQSQKLNRANGLGRICFGLRDLLREKLNIIKLCFNFQSLLNLSIVAFPLWEPLVAPVEGIWSGYRSNHRLWGS